MMLKYSMSASNTFDMLRILEGKGKETAGLASLGNGIKDQINQMKTEIRNGVIFCDTLMTCILVCFSYSGAVRSGARAQRPRRATWASGREHDTRGTIPRI